MSTRPNMTSCRPSLLAMAVHERAPKLWRVDEERDYPTVFQRRLCVGELFGQFEPHFALPQRERGLQGHVIRNDGEPLRAAVGDVGTCYTVASVSAGMVTRTGGVPVGGNPHAVADGTASISSTRGLSGQIAAYPACLK